MRKLITVSLLGIGLYIGSVYYSNTYLHNDKITSSETNVKVQSLEKILQERYYDPIVVEKQALNSIYNSNINVVTIIENETIPIYDVPLDKDLQKYIYKLSKIKNVPYELVLGVIKTESNFNPALSHKNKNGSTDKGLMQINSVHKKWCNELGITDLFDPYQNVKIGVEMLSNIYKEYPNIHKTMMIYNMGISGAKRNWKVGRGTTTYSRKVVNNINIIKSSK